MDKQEVFEGIIRLHKEGRTHKEIMQEFEITNGAVKWALEKYKKNKNLIARPKRIWSKEMLAIFKRNGDINREYEKRGGCNQNMRTKDTITGQVQVSGSDDPLVILGRNAGYGV